METAAGPQKKKKTIRMIPQARTPAHEQDPQERARNFEEVNCGYQSRTRSSRPSAA